MNIYTQVCGLVVIFIIIIFSAKKKNLNLRTEFLFKWILAVDIVTIFLDIISVFLIYYKDSLPIILVNMEAKAYLVSLIAITYLCYLYVLVDIYKDYNKFKNIWLTTMFISIGLGLVVLAVPITVVHEGNMIYSEGLACYITYATVFLTIISTIYLATKYLSKKNIVKRNSIYVWLSLWVISAIVQFFFKDILIVSFASALGILVIHLQLEKGNIKYNYVSKLFTKDALNIFISDNKFKNKDYQLFYITYYYINHDTFRIIANDFYNYLANLEGVLPFLVEDESVVLVFPENQNKDILLGNLISRFHEGFGPIDNNIHVSPKIFYLNNFKTLEDQGIQKVLNFANDIKYDFNQSLYYNLDEKVINELVRTQKVEKIILNAIQEDRIVANYQPIYSIACDKFDAAEALIRIVGDDGNLIYPDEFIPIAEKNGMITTLDYAIFDKVCKFISENDLDSLGLKFIDVNVSAIQAVDDHMAKKYISILKKYRVDPKYIKLEITESAVITNRESLINNMLELVDYGINFALDDYGVGNSNISYLASLPIKYVKIDKTFTELFFIDDKANYIVKNEIKMFKGLNLYVVFEGVEEKEQLDGLLTLPDIDFIQGYYYSRPVAEKEFVIFLERFNNKKI